MAKPKHTVFCYECGHSKMLFKTEEKANRFIEYNAETIGRENKKGKKPIRSYYCSVCGGWHVTSAKSNPHKKYDLTNKIISLYHEDVLNKKMILKNSELTQAIKDMVNNFQYIGLFLTHESKEILKHYLQENFSYKINYDKLFLDHCTILHHSQIDNKNAIRCLDRYIKDNEKSIKETIIINKIGWNNKAMAFGCIINVPCVNSQPHITICTFGDGKPVESNSITNWIDIKPIKVKAVMNKV